MRIHSISLFMDCVFLYAWPTQCGCLYWCFDIRFFYILWRTRGLAQQPSYFYCLNHIQKEKNCITQALKCFLFGNKMWDCNTMWFNIYIIMIWLHYIVFIYKDGDTWQRSKLCIFTLGQALLNQYRRNYTRLDRASS